MAKAGPKSAHHSVGERPENAEAEVHDKDGGRGNAAGLKLASVKLPTVKVPKVNLQNVKVPEMTTRNAAIGVIGVGVVAAVVAAGAALLRGRPEKRDAVRRDVAADDDKVSIAQTAPKVVTPADVIDDDKRAAFAPATKPVPSRIEAMGNGDD